jgi:hypothetical protein
MRLSRVGSKACTDIHTVCSHVSSAPENEDGDALIHSGATFADLQLLPNLGAWHGSECKSTISCHLARYSGIFVTISYHKLGIFSEN